MTHLKKYINQGKMLMKESTHILPPQKNKIDTIGKTEKSQKSQEAVVTSKNKKNYTFYNAAKSISIPVTNISNKRTQLEKNLRNIYSQDNLGISVLYGQGESLESLTTYKQRITCNNKRKKTPASQVIRKEPIGDTVNPRKISQEDTVLYPENVNQHKLSRYF